MGIYFIIVWWICLENKALGVARNIPDFIEILSAMLFLILSVFLDALFSWSNADTIWSNCSILLSWLRLLFSNLAPLSLPIFSWSYCDCLQEHSIWGISTFLLPSRSKLLIDVADVLHEVQHVTAAAAALFYDIIIARFILFATLYY